MRFNLIVVAFILLYLEAHQASYQPNSSLISLRPCLHICLVWSDHMSVETDGCLHLALTCLKCLDFRRLSGCFHLKWQILIACELSRRPSALRHQHQTWSLQNYFSKLFTIIPVANLHLFHLVKSDALYRNINKCINIKKKWE